MNLFRKSTSNTGKTDTHERFLSLPNKAYHEKFFKACIDEILNLAVFQGTERSKKVLLYKDPEEMEEILDVKLKHEGKSDEKSVIFWN